jgi:proteasome lid subunit RPN8/RPN11
MFDRSVQAAAQAHAIAQYPKESCGLVVDGAYVEAVNQLGEEAQRDAFAIDPALIVEYGDRLQAVVHSHPDTWPVPSAADMRQQQAMALPWGILAVGPDPSVRENAPVVTSAITWFGPGAPKAPVLDAKGIGRGFIHGIQDCFSAILDWHADRDIINPEWPRDWEWWRQRGETAPEDLYRAHFEEMGCVAIDAPRPGAVFFACMGKNDDGSPIMIPNHGGVYLGNGLILHHLTAQKAIDPTRLAARQPAGRWVKFMNRPPQWVIHREMTDSLAAPV